MADKDPALPLITFGHGTASAERIAELLRSAGVTRLIDVRIAPGSRRNPHVARAELERWLPRHGITYRWEKRLGGFRQPERGSPDVAWQEAAFRGYAGHMRRSDFLAAIDELLAPAAVDDVLPPAAIDELLRPAATEGLLPPAATGQLAVMCSESTWWRCHRRLIADFAEIARGVPVRHLMHDGALTPHRHSPGVRLRADGLLVYDGGQQQLG